MTISIFSRSVLMNQLSWTAAAFELGDKTWNPLIETETVTLAKLNYIYFQVDKDTRTQAALIRVITNG